MIRRLWPLMAALVLMLGSVGCASSYVARSARISLADFVIDVFAEVARASITPDL